jgi:hypothetical protein
LPSAATASSRSAQSFTVTALAGRWPSAALILLSMLRRLLAVLAFSAAGILTNSSAIVLSVPASRSTSVAR